LGRNRTRDQRIQRERVFPLSYGGEAHIHSRRMSTPETDMYFLHVVQPTKPRVGIGRPGGASRDARGGRHGAQVPRGGTRTSPRTRPVASHFLPLGHHGHGNETSPWPVGEPLAGDRHGSAATGGDLRSGEAPRGGVQQYPEVGGRRVDGSPKRAGERPRGPI
jgi:hypothetical protein